MVTRFERHICNPKLEGSIEGPFRHHFPAPQELSNCALVGRTVNSYQTVSEPLRQLGLNSDGLKPKEVIDLDENACVSAVLMEEHIVNSITSGCPANTEGHSDKNDAREGVDAASSYSSNQESKATVEILRRFFITCGHDGHGAISRIAELNGAYKPLINRLQQ